MKLGSNSGSFAPQAAALIHYTLGLSNCLVLDMNNIWTVNALIGDSFIVAGLKLFFARIKSFSDRVF